MKYPEFHPPGSRVSRDRQRLRVIRNGDQPRPWDDAYHLLLTLPWSGFLALIVLAYFGVNALFACIYLLDAAGIANARPGNFIDAFFFSVQTIATVGYGAMYPTSVFVQVVAAAEALVGLTGVSMATGLMFARLSRPTARVLFSRYATILRHQGTPTLMFRMANQRHNQILEAQVQVAFVHDEVTAEGMEMRHFKNLHLIRSQSPMFALSWTVMHPIDRNSPLYGRSLHSLSDDDAIFIVSLTGIDETMGQIIHARHIYTAADLHFNYRLVDILSRHADGSVGIDYGRFHDIAPLEDEHAAIATLPTMLPPPIIRRRDRL